MSPKKKSYKVLCISMYWDDYNKAKAKVDELKKAGYTMASVSWLVRQALSRLDISKLPPPTEFYLGGKS